MLNLKKSTSITVMVLSLSGCFVNESDSLLLKRVNELHDNVSKTQHLLALGELSSKQKVSKAIEENPKLGVIASYYISNKRRSLNDEGFIEELLSINSLLLSESSMVSMYRTLKANGVPSVKVLSINNAPNLVGYQVRDKWKLVVSKSSSYAFNYPYNAFELSQYEKLSYTNDICNQGYEPLAIPTLLVDLNYQGEVPQVSVVDEGNSWRVIIDDESVNAHRFFKALVEVKCRLAS